MSVYVTTTAVLVCDHFKEKKPKLVVFAWHLSSGQTKLVWKLLAVVRHTCFLKQDFIWENWKFYPIFQRFEEHLLSNWYSLFSGQDSPTIRIFNVSVSNLENPHEWLVCLAIACFSVICEKSDLFGKRRMKGVAQHWSCKAFGRKFPRRLVARGKQL